MSENFNSLYKRFRNRLRPFTKASIIGAAVNAMRQVAPGNVQALEHAPWQIMLIVKWALQDPMVRDTNGGAITQAEFDYVRQKLYELTAGLKPSANVTVDLFVRRLVYQQVAFQRQPHAGFVRQPALLSTLGQGHLLRRIFDKEVGLAPEEFIDLSFAVYSLVIDGSMELPQTVLGTLASRYGPASLAQFWKLVSRDFLGLQRYCRSLAGAGRPVASEVFELTPIRQIPFLAVGHQYFCWHPMLFYRGMEELVHLAMSSEGGKYAEQFGRLFEAHVRSEVDSIGIPVLHEEDLQKLVPRDTKVPDALFVLL